MISSNFLSFFLLNTNMKYQFRILQLMMFQKYIFHDDVIVCVYMFYILKKCTYFITPPTQTLHCPQCEYMIA